LGQDGYVLKIGKVGIGSDIARPIWSRAEDAEENAAKAAGE
jgi:hypothetical protein